MATNWGSSLQGWGQTGSVGSDPKAIAAQLHPLLGQGLQAMEQAYPGYVNGLTQQIHQFGTANGQQSLVNNQRSGFNAAAMDNGRAGANQVGFNGGGESLQNATRMAAQQQGFGAGNQYQAHLASPEGQQAAQGLVNQDVNALGAGSPAFNLFSQIFNEEMQRRQINNSAPQSGGFFSSLLGAAAPLAGSLIPGLGHPQAQSSGGAGGGASQLGYGVGQGAGYPPLSPQQIQSLFPGVY